MNAETLKAMKQGANVLKTIHGQLCVFLSASGAVSYRMS